MSANTNEQIISGILPKIIINKITLSDIKYVPNPRGTRDVVRTAQQEEFQELTVKLDLILKETIDNNDIGTWFNDINILKYVKIQIIQSTNKIVSDILSYSNDIIQITDFNNKNFLTNDMLSRVPTRITRQEVYNLITETTVIQNKSLSDMGIINNTIENYSAYQNSDGKLIYEIPCSFSFIISEIEPEHLAYFTVCRLDLQSLCSDFNIDLDIAKNIEENGRVSSEIVIDDFNVVNYSYVYVDNFGDIWDGDVHLDANRNWKSGDGSSPNSIPLRQITVNNNKIQDFRNIEIIKKLIDFSELEQFSTNFIDTTKIQTLDYKLYNKQEPIFTRIYISRNSSNSKRFLFGINFNEAIKQFSSLGFLFQLKNDRIKQNILENSKILNLNIIKKRVSKEVRSSEDLKGLQPFKDDQEEYSLISSKDLNGWKTFLNLEDTKVLSAIREDNLATKDANNSVPYFIRYFNVVDDENTNVYSNGIYQYDIELEIEDGTVNFITSKIYDLQISLQKLIEYYNVITTPTIRKYFLESDEPHIETIKKDFVDPAVITPGFDILSNKISDALADKLIRYYENIAPWITETAIYVDTLDIFTEDPSNEAQRVENRQKFVEIIYNYLYPRSATPSSVLKVIEMYDYMITSLARLVKINPNSSIERTDLKFTEFISSKKEARTFKIKHTFSDTINENILNRYGIDYLATSNRDSMSDFYFKKINLSTLIQRIVNEKNKFFKTTPSFRVSVNNSSVDLLNASQEDFYSFISPVRYDFPDRSLKVAFFAGGGLEASENDIFTNQNRTVNFYNGNMFYNACSYFSDLLSLKVKSEINNEKKDTILVNNTLFRLTQRERITEELKQIFSLTNNVLIKSSIESALNLNSTGISLVNITEDPKKQDLLKFLIMLTIPITKINRASFSPSQPAEFRYIDPDIAYQNKIGNTSYVLSTLDTTNITEETFQMLKKIPYQLKAIALKSQDFVSVLSRYQDYSNFNSAIESITINGVLFENIVAIQYLDNFVNDENQINLRTERWVTLTYKRLLDLISYASSVGPKNILCRISPFINFESGYQPDPNLLDAIYDQHFILDLNMSNTNPVIPISFEGES